MSENINPPTNFTAASKGLQENQAESPCFPFKALIIMEGTEDITATEDHQQECGGATAEGSADLVQERKKWNH